MKTFIKASLLLTALALTGCAEMVKKTYSPVRSGTVRYSTTWFLGEKNRSKAMEEMRTYCSPGRAQLLSEDNKLEFTGNSYSNSRSENNYTSTNTTQSREGFVYLHFKCSGKTSLSQR